MEVDKDGYFTSDFNEVANISSDIKFHSSTMESIVRAKTQTKAPFYRFYKSRYS
ncbi:MULTISPECIES: hypothetical protein [unclassified Campylobacter]|uniref:hypothetical protein n=1 Tax=unclassified Campylobacter TaxID=2593542 RepID=UPI0016806192|nr:MULTISPECIES: hypothetical protein [unclassified Campylobacter]